MTEARQGNTVKVHYTGKLDDGTVFDSSAGAQPLEFTIGQGQMIPGFEQGVVGMEQGETRTVIVAAEQAYGIHRPDGVFDVDRSEIPPSIPLEVGMQLQATSSDGRPRPNDGNRAFRRQGQAGRQPSPGWQGPDL